MKTKILTNKELSIMQEYLDYGIKKSGFTALLKKCLESIDDLTINVEIIQEFLTRTYEKGDRFNLKDD